MEQKCTLGRAAQGCRGSTSLRRLKVGVNSGGDGEGLLKAQMPRLAPGPEI